MEKNLNKRRFKIAVRDKLLFVVWIAVLFLLTELMLAKYVRKIKPYRIIGYRWQLCIKSEPYLGPTKVMTYRLKKNYRGRYINGKKIYTDRYGFRTNDVDKELKHIDILCLGDSYTFGFNVGDDETYPYYLQSLFKDGIVVNGGYNSGVSFDTAYLLYKTEYYKFGPKVVIYGLFAGNDYSELGLWVKQENGYPVAIQDISAYKTRYAYSVPILRESRLFVGAVRLLTAFFDKGKIDEFETNKWNYIDKIICDWKKIAEKNKARLVFVFFDCAGFDKWKKDYKPSNTRMKSILDKYGIENYSINDVKLEQVCAKDPHYSPSTNKLVADKIASICNAPH